MPGNESPGEGQGRPAGRLPKPTSARRSKTTSGILLELAIATAGAERLASALQLTKQDVERIAAEGRPMTLPQQRILALAVLTISEHHPDMRRRAKALLGQVRASEEFAAGVTERHAQSPPPAKW
jgi:hypothetical protein